MGREINQRKAAIIGCGFVGSATAFTLMQSQLFSELVLVDVDFDKADGEAKDIAHGIPFAGQMKIHAGGYYYCDCRSRSEAGRDKIGFGA